MALAALAFAAAGCAALGILSAGPDAVAFSHRLHAEQGLECSDCHARAAEHDDPGMPIATGCALCHDTIDAGKPAERRVAALFDGDTFRAAHRYRLGGDVVFSHLRHVGAGIECAGCHVGVAQNERIAAAVPLGMADCTACHAQRAVANECATCHATIRIDVPPPSHAFAWRRTHGVAAHGSADPQRCSLCHTESSCTACHRATMPESHTNYWRQRAHGLHASMDRRNCAACHRADSCDACHRETRPTSHVGTWGSTRNNHCLSCHLGAADTGCATCHRSAPSHALAAPLPPGHSPAMNCRQCHGGVAPLSHADNGGLCTSCHR